VETKVVSIPLKSSYVFAHHVADAFRNVLVWVQTDDGVSGVGEISFSGRGGGIYPDTPEAAKGQGGLCLAPEVLGEDPFDVARIHAKMDEALPGNLVAKSGIDLALWDVMGKAVGLPAYKLLGGAHGERIRCTYTLSIDTPEQMAKSAAMR